MTDREEAQLFDESTYVLRIREPRSGRLQGQIDEIEAVLCDAVDLFGNGPARKVHRTYVHVLILPAFPRSHAGVLAKKGWKPWMRS